MPLPLPVMPLRPLAKPLVTLLLLRAMLLPPLRLTRAMLLPMLRAMLPPLPATPLLPLATPPRPLAKLLRKL